MVVGRLRFGLFLIELGYLCLIPSISFANASIDLIRAD